MEGKVFEAIQEKLVRRYCIFMHCFISDIREKTKWMGGKRKKILSHIYTLTCGLT